MKRVILVLMVLVLVLCSCNANASTLSKLQKKYPKARVYTTKQIDKKPSILTKRKGKYTLIEVTQGVCINKRKDGRIINTIRKKYNYISYRGVKGIRKGSRITTYFVYDDSNEVDTIIKRVDVVKKK